MCVCIYVCKCIYICVCMCACVCVVMYVCIYMQGALSYLASQICEQVSLKMYVCMYVCIYMYMCIYIYVYLCVCVCLNSVITDLLYISYQLTRAFLYWDTKKRKIKAKPWNKHQIRSHAICDSLIWFQKQKDKKPWSCWPQFDQPLGCLKQNRYIKI